MKKILSAVLEAGILLCCLSIVLGQTPQKPLENVFTLELSFGDKDVPDEFLLAQSRWLDVNDAGDIYVFDEYKVKVFDKNGKPKAIFGGRGEGPGEFTTSVNRLCISPTGFLTIIESQSYSIFSPANKFIVKNRYLSSAVFNTLKNEYKFSYGGGLESIKNIIALSDKELIIIGSTVADANYNEAGEYYDYLFYADVNKVSVISQYRNTDTFMFETVGGGGGIGGLTHIGNFRFAILPDTRILYTHTCHDVKYTNNTAQLTFHIVSPEKNMKSEFSFTYKPEAIPDSVIESYEPSTVEKRNNELAKRMNRTPPKKMVEEQKKMYNDIVNLLKQKKYRPLFTAMQSDGVYLFLRCRASDNKMSLIKVINSETGKEVSNFIQPSNFYLDSIKNGYAYLSTTPKDGYPIVQKYRINPTVYGK